MPVLNAKPCFHVVQLLCVIITIIAKPVIHMRDKVSDKEMEVIHLTVMSHLRYCWYCINATQVVTVYKRSLRRLCFYTCLSFCPPGGGGAGVSAPVGSPDPHLGGLQAHPRGGLQTHTRGGVSRPTPGGCIPACTEAAPPPYGYCCGRYTSYWNAFLFNYVNGSEQGSVSFKVHIFQGRIKIAQTKKILYI